MKKEHQCCNKPLAIFAHPGHELKIYGLLHILNLDIIYLTDGSGSSGNSRKYQSEAICRVNNCTINELSSLPDSIIYHKILNQDTDYFINIMEEIVDYVITNSIDFIIADNLEGYNAVHDICRYIANCVVIKVQQMTGVKVRNGFVNLTNQSLHYLKNYQVFESLNLDEDLFIEKINAAKSYHEISSDINFYLERFGVQEFCSEYVFALPAHELHVLENWQNIPYYEDYGNKKIIHGIYDKQITFKDHVRPIAKALYHCVGVDS